MRATLMANHGGTNPAESFRKRAFRVPADEAGPSEQPARRHPFALSELIHAEQPAADCRRCLGVGARQQHAGKRQQQIRAGAGTGQRRRGLQPLPCHAQSARIERLAASALQHSDRLRVTGKIRAHGVFGGLSRIDAARQQCSERGRVFARANGRRHSLVQRLAQQRVGKFRHPVLCANDTAGEQALQRFLRFAS